MFLKKNKVFLCALLLVFGVVFMRHQTIAQLQISGDFGAQYWAANFTTPGWGNFSGGGPGGGGGGGLTEADIKIIIEALVDPLFVGGKINFETALRSYIDGGQEVYAKMVSTNPAYYQGFMDYVSTDEGRKLALDNLGKLIDPDKLLEGDFSVNVDPPAVPSNDFAGMGYSPPQIKQIQDTLAKNPTWLCDGDGYYIPKPDGKKIRVSDDYPALKEATGELGMPVKELPCYGLPEGFDPYTRQGVDPGGTGFLDPPVTPTPTVTTNAACTSYTYSEWGACGGGVQARSILHQYPSGCTDTATAILTQNCTMPTVVCSSYVYSDWSACVGGSQTRSIVSKSPTGCTDTSSAVFTQSCAPDCAVHAPVVSNTTAAEQNTANPILSVVTDRPANCEYNANGGFVFGAGTAFSATGGYNHNAGLTNIAVGEKTYYAICKDSATGCFSAPVKIDFTITSVGQEGECADLVSNDRKNNANRSHWGNQNLNSAYLWQAVETGTRDKFDKVDWHAGYQFTPEKDGKVNQLCGNFAAGTANRVSLYDGSYAELAGVKITGNDRWECADIAPVEIKTDRRYYVIARIDNNPVYFEYKSGMMPKRTGNAVIEAGIRQSTGQQAFDYEIRKYDYMIFGLVDARVSWSPATLTGPAFIAANPSGAVSGDVAVLSLTTSGAAECRFGREDVDYGQMSYLMGKTAADSFAQKVCGLEPGDYTFYARCKNASGAENNTSAEIQFTVSE